MTFRVLSFADAFSGKWVVVRLPDWRVMTQAGDVRDALAWVRTWGDSVGQRKGGQDFPERLRSRLVVLSHERPD